MTTPSGATGPRAGSACDSWGDAALFAAAHPALADYPMPLVQVALAALHPNSPSVIATAAQDRQVWIPAGVGAHIVAVQSHADGGQVLLASAFGRSFSGGRPVTVFTAVQVAEVCEDLQFPVVDGLAAVARNARLTWATEALDAAGGSDAETAVAWWQQDTLGGRAYGTDPAATARRVLTGLDDGDPAVLDLLPTCPAYLVNALFAEVYAHITRSVPSLAWSQLTGSERHYMLTVYQAGFDDGRETAVRAACDQVLGEYT